MQGKAFLKVRNPILTVGSCVLDADLEVLIV